MTQENDQKPTEQKPDVKPYETVDDGKAVVINGVKYLVQDHVNTLVGSARTEGRNSGKTEAEQAAADAEAARVAAAEAEQGNFKKLYETAQAKIKALETERDDAVKAKMDLELSSIRTRVAAKHKITDLADRIRGTTEAEMEADAAEIAKHVAPSKAPDTQMGTGADNKAQDDAQTPKTPNDKPKTTRYAFQTPGEVSW